MMQTENNQIGSVRPTSLSEFEERLALLAAGCKTAMPHFVSCEDQDSSENYCPNCAQVTAEQLHGRAVWDSMLEGPQWCAQCGVKLHCLLDDLGVREELSRFQTKGYQDTPEDHWDVWMLAHSILVLRLPLEDQVLALWRSGNHGG